MRTEITFDFHRLGVLLLRAAVREGAVVANKIATATLGDARIQATLRMYLYLYVLLNLLLNSCNNSKNLWKVNSKSEIKYN